MNPMHRPWLAALLGAAIVVGLPATGFAQFKNAALQALTKRFDVRADLKTIPFQEALGVMSRASGAAITIDPQSLKKGQNLTELQNHPIRVPKLNAVLLAPILRHMTRQVGGSYLIRGDQLVVVFDKPDANATTSAKTPLQQQLEAAVNKQLTKKVSVAKLSGIALDDALTTLANQHKLNVLIDSAEFARVGKKDVAETAIELAAQKNVTLGAALQKILEPVRGAYHVRDNVIWIEPSGRK